MCGCECLALITGHTTNNNCITGYSTILLLIILIIIFYENPLKTHLSKGICIYATWVKPFWLCVHPDKLIYGCYCSNMKSLTLSRASLRNIKDLVLISYLTFPRSTLTSNRLNVQSDPTIKQSHLKRNDGVVFIVLRVWSLWLLLIATLIYYA